jgi:two-component system, NarL family, response regulator
MAKKRIRVLIADDHPVFRIGLAALINTQPDMEVAGEASNGKQVMDEFHKVKPDITLIDLRMPEMGGVDTIGALIKEHPKAKTIVVTTYQGEDQIYRAMQSGARGYILKDSLHQELLDAIRAVHSGQRFLPSRVAERLAQRVALSDLTARELEILTLIVKGKSNKEIAAELNIAEGTVKNHILKILDKLDVSDRTQAATAAISRGILHLD